MDTENECIQELYEIQNDKDVNKLKYTKNKIKTKAETTDQNAFPLNSEPTLGLTEPNERMKSFLFSGAFEYIESYK